MAGRRSIASLANRGAAAIVGGYILANAFAWVLAIILHRAGLAKLAHSIHWATIVSFLVWAGLAMWIFAPGRLTAKLVWMGGATALCVSVGFAVGYGPAL